jgi:hypothetical protein
VLAAAVLAFGVLVPGATADAQTMPAPDPAPRVHPGPPYLPDTTRPVPMPHALPRGPRPVPMPHVLPRGPKPVPMPHVRDDRADLLPPPRR